VGARRFNDQQLGSRSEAMLEPILIIGAHQEAGDCLGGNVSGIGCPPGGDRHLFNGGKISLRSRSNMDGNRLLIPA
jgi:hypothetical protein